MLIGLPFLAAAFDPKVIGTLADSLFQVVHDGPPFAVGWSPPSRLDPSEKAGGHYAAGFPQATAGPAVRFRRFVKESIGLDS